MHIIILRCVQISVDQHSVERMDGIKQREF